MEKPTSIKFDGLEIPTDNLLRPGQHGLGPMDLSWTRVQFIVPDAYTSPQKVHDWLIANCPGLWSTHNYQNPKGKSSEHNMIVRFQDRNDALMFKLRDGHRAWEA